MSKSDDGEGEVPEFLSAPQPRPDGLIRLKCPQCDGCLCPVVASHPCMHCDFGHVPALRGVERRMASGPSRARHRFKRVDKE